MLFFVRRQHCTKRHFLRFRLGLTLIDSFYLDPILSQLHLSHVNLCLSLSMVRISLVYGLSQSHRSLVLVLSQSCLSLTLVLSQSRLTIILV